MIESIFLLVLGILLGFELFRQTSSRSDSSVAFGISALSAAGFSVAAVLAAEVDPDSVLAGLSGFAFPAVAVLAVLALMSGGMALVGGIILSARSASVAGRNADHKKQGG